MNPLTEWHGHLPSHWPLVPLRYVAELGTGHTPDRTKPEYWVDCDIPWVTAADLSNRPSDFEPLAQTAQHVSAIGVANSAAVVHPTGTVMFCRTASVGLLTVIGRPMATTQAFVTWSPGPQLLSRYLLYVLSAMRPELFRIAYGSTHLTIYMPDLEALRVPLPPREEQRRIVDFLDEQVSHLDRLIAARIKQSALLDERLMARLEQRVLDLSAEFEVLKLGRLIRRIEQGWSPQCEDRVPSEQEWGVLKVSAVKSGAFRVGESKALPADIAPNAAFEVHPGDLLVSRANSPKLVGEMAVVPDGSSPELSRRSMIVRPKIWERCS